MQYKYKIMRNLPVPNADLTNYQKGVLCRNQVTQHSSTWLKILNHNIKVFKPMMS